MQGLKIAKYPQSPWLELAAAVVIKAAHDAKRGDVIAASWLQGPVAELYIDALGGIDPEMISNWAATYQAPPF